MRVSSGTVGRAGGATAAGGGGGPFGFANSAASSRSMRVSRPFARAGFRPKRVAYSVRSGRSPQRCRTRYSAATISPEASSTEPSSGIKPEILLQPRLRTNVAGRQCGGDGRRGPTPAILQVEHHQLFQQRPPCGIGRPRFWRQKAIETRRRALTPGGFELGQERFRVEGGAGLACAPARSSPLPHSVGRPNRTCFRWSFTRFSVRITVRSEQSIAAAISS